MVRTHFRPPETGPEWEPNGSRQRHSDRAGRRAQPVRGLDDVPPEEFADTSDVPPEDEPYSNSDIDTRKLTVTFIKDETGRRCAAST